MACLPKVYCLLELDVVELALLVLVPLGEVMLPRLLELLTVVFSFVALVELPLLLVPLVVPV
ncbi:MAG TPA: hypothetical protein VKY92_08355 [Verrucomicrobiae bacterium]|nr:hypothetical protein [Verrucomicrobiae bacterium]